MFGKLWEGVLLFIFLSSDTRETVDSHRSHIISLYFDGLILFILLVSTLPSIIDLVCYIQVSL